MLKEMLAVRQTCLDINSGAIQRRLLAESDLTLTKAIAVAQGAEIGDTEVKELQSNITCIQPQTIRMCKNALLSILPGLK